MVILKDDFIENIAAAIIVFLLFKIKYSDCVLNVTLNLYTWYNTAIFMKFLIQNFEISKMYFSRKLDYTKTNYFSFYI